MARRTISVADTLCCRLSWRNFATLRRGTRYCWRTSSSTLFSMRKLYTVATHTQLIHMVAPAARVVLALLLASVPPPVDGAAEGGGAMMQAALARGGRVRLQTLPRPRPAAGEVLVAVRFAGVNPGDWKYASGRADGAAEAGPAATGRFEAEGATAVP